jgi:hypothetical protein
MQPDGTVECNFIPAGFYCSLSVDNTLGPVRRMELTLNLLRNMRWGGVRILWTSRLIWRSTVFLPDGATAPSAPQPPQCRGFRIKDTSHSVELLWTGDQPDADLPIRPLPDNTQHSQKTDIHAPGGIRTHNPSRQTTANPRFRPRGQCDRHMLHYARLYIVRSQQLGN